MDNKILKDEYGRQLNYLRLSVTDRCNFRCYYCMPEEGVLFAARKDLLSFEEMIFLTKIFTALGVTKIRVTGGEPFVRYGIMPFLSDLSMLDGVKEVSITTNGTLSEDYVCKLKQTNIRKINISIDSLNRERFFKITRRDNFEAVYLSMMRLLREGFSVKLNCVVSVKKNIEDILPFVEMTRDLFVRVRFLEEMPFNGSSEFNALNWTYKDVYHHISARYPDIVPLENEPHSTSQNYQIPGYRGAFGIIPSFSRTFCGTCNRIRLSAAGELRTCLYGPPAVNLRDLMRGGATSADLQGAIITAVNGRAKDGFEAEARNPGALTRSMSGLGG